MPKDVAKLLKFLKPNLYTGHSMRRTPATFLVDGGADLQKHEILPVMP